MQNRKRVGQRPAVPTLLPYSDYAETTFAHAARNGSFAMLQCIDGEILKEISGLWRQGMVCIDWMEGNRLLAVYASALET